MKIINKVKVMVVKRRQFSINTHDAGIQDSRTLSVKKGIFSVHCYCKSWILYTTQAYIYRLKHC